MPDAPDLSRNNLDRETSPYLLQHKDNPVHWQAWGPEVLAAARRQNKPILLSVGYAACHWCHVMAHESFEDAAVADLMNEAFVAVKVDREERPDVDQIYQTALALLGQQGGWPLTMFLAPDGAPFWGGTYFPPDSRWGRPGFRDVLRRVSEVFDTDPDTVARNRDALLDALNKHAGERPAATVQITPALLDQVADRLLEEVDHENGGIGGAPKFPQTTILESLWRSARRGGGDAKRDAVTLSLTRMCQGGIYDHLGGGFARYATDARWLVPHFEKMLYDNALLLDLMTLVWAETGDALLAQRVRETVAWVAREMVADGGGFAASLDADSEGEEGRYYVWDAAEIDRLLGADSDVFKAAYDVAPGGNWEGKTILNRLANPALGSAEDEARLGELRTRLLASRERRVRPGWDDKVLADWNGLMIHALAAAGLAFDRPAWLDLARAAFDFITSEMTVAGRLRHAARAGRARHDALLDDYATLARAALKLHEATGDGRYLTQAEAWVAVLDAHYWDPDGGGYFFTADDAEALILRTRNIADNATPAGNAVMVEVLAKLWYVGGNDDYRRRAEALIEAFSGELTRNFFPLATFLNAVDLMAGAVQVVIVGPAGDADRAALARAAHRAPQPNRLVQLVAADQVLPAAHPAHGKGLVDGRPAAYVCVGTTCSLPITAPAALADRIAAAGRPGAP